MSEKPIVTVPWHSDAEERERERLEEEAHERIQQAEAAVIAAAEAFVDARTKPAKGLRLDVDRTWPALVDAVAAYRKARKGNRG